MASGSTRVCARKHSYPKWHVALQGRTVVPTLWNTLRMGQPLRCRLNLLLSNLLLLPLLLLLLLLSFFLFQERHREYRVVLWGVEEEACAE